MSIAQNIQKIKSELPSGVKLVAVSKFHPVEALREAYDAGQRVFGESRPQELYAKAVRMPDDVLWHFIGHLQKNKLKIVLPYVSVVESVDSEELLTAMENWTAAHPGTVAGDSIDVFLEIHISSEPSKQGFSPEEALQVLTGPAKWPHIRFCGLMGMASFTDDEAVVRGDFRKLLDLNDALRPYVGLSPNLTEAFRELSFGMSEDYRIAVSMGATVVRIGTAIFGERETAFDPVR